MRSNASNRGSVVGSIMATIITIHPAADHSAGTMVSPPGMAPHSTAAGVDAVQPPCPR
jgi:hypothetical protein